MSTQITISSGGSFKLEGTNYLSVLADGTPLQNGKAVRDAYTAAIAMTPNGLAKSPINRVIILLAPGYYDFDEASLGDFTVDQSFIDLESLSGFTDVYFSSIRVLSTGGGKNIYLAGINTTKNSYLPTGPFVVQTVGTANEFIYIKNCVGGDYSFGAYCGGFNGVIEDCAAGNFSFGYMSDFAPVGISFVGINPTNYGVYRNCSAGYYSFLSSDTTASGYGAVANYGTIENCRAGSNSFLFAQKDSVNNAGTIHNCQSTGSYCFLSSVSGGMFLDNSGLISSCIGIDYSFVALYDTGVFPANYGKIINCFASGTETSFVACLNNPTFGRNYGIISECNASNIINAFCGSQGSNFGLINNCIAWSQSFCSGAPGFIYSDIYRCTLRADVFSIGPTPGGRVVLGIDTTGVVNF